jgi:hypothetical protein
MQIQQVGVASRPKGMGVHVHVAQGDTSGTGLSVVPRQTAPPFLLVPRTSACRVPRGAGAVAVAAACSLLFVKSPLATGSSSSTDIQNHLSAPGHSSPAGSTPHTRFRFGLWPLVSRFGVRGPCRSLVCSHFVGLLASCFLAGDWGSPST